MQSADVYGCQRLFLRSSGQVFILTYLRYFQENKITFFINFRHCEKGRGIGALIRRVTDRPFQIVLGTFLAQFGFGSTILITMIREHFFGQRASSDNFFGKQANF